MSVTKKSIILALVFLTISLGAWYYSYILNPKVQTNLDDYPTFVATDTHSKVYDESGTLIKTMDSELTFYYDEKSYFTFTKPLLTSIKYENGEPKLWHLKGDRGDMTTDKYANVYDNVVVYPDFDDPVMDHATADYLHYDFSENDITSDNLVTVYGKAFQTEGTDFRLELNTNKATYKGKPHAIYYPQQNK